MAGELELSKDSPGTMTFSVPKHWIIPLLLVMTAMCGAFAWSGAPIMYFAAALLLLMLVYMVLYRDDLSFDLEARRFTRVKVQWGRSRTLQSGSFDEIEGLFLMPEADYNRSPGERTKVYRGVNLRMRFRHRKTPVSLLWTTDVDYGREQLKYVAERLGVKHVDRTAPAS